MIYRPQWNENDKPTVRCPHIKGRRIGDEYCQKECPNLNKVIDQTYATLIDCHYPKWPNCRKDNV